jgi:hypothetical protein
MSKTARKLFEKKAAYYGLDMTSGPYGEWLDAQTRSCWYFWISAWYRRSRDIKERSKKG